MAPSAAPASVPGPLVIGGMHRSGTSFTASVFAGAGLDLGPDLLGATDGNARGHYEDTGFLDFHIRALVAQGYGREGYVTQPCDVPPLLEPVARGLVAERAAGGRPWGWKEPRTTLFLDFWQRIAPDARHVFVFRPPWEVVDSIFRRGDTPFLENPSHALDVWVHYNRLIVDFVRRHPDRCLVFDIGQVIADPAAAVATVSSRLDMPLGDPQACFEPALFTRDESSLHATIVRAASPAACELLDELRSLADVDPRATAVAERCASATAAACALAEWSRASRAETALRVLQSRPPAPVAPEPAVVVEPALVAEPGPASALEIAAEPACPTATVPLVPHGAEHCEFAAAATESTAAATLGAEAARPPWRRWWRTVAKPCEAFVKASWHALRGTPAQGVSTGVAAAPESPAHAA